MRPRALWSVGKAFSQTTIINVSTGQATAKIDQRTAGGPHGAGSGLGPGRFHGQSDRPPVSGNNYFNAGRANGLSFWESAGVTAFRQRHLGILRRDQPRVAERPHQHDARRHRARRDVSPHGLAGAQYARNRRGRLASEIAATAIDPITGVNRFITGDAHAFREAAEYGAVAIWADIRRWARSGEAPNTRAFASFWRAFPRDGLALWRPARGPHRTPYDAFAVRLRFGGGAEFSEARVRGRLIGQPFKQGRFQVNVQQAYDFEERRLQFGAHSFELHTSFTTKLS